MFCRSPNSISIITSFFLVRGLKGTFTFSFSPQQKQNNDELKLPCVAPSSSFLSKIGEETLKKLHEGKFHPSSSKNKLEQQQQPEDILVSAAVDRQLEYLHCLLMNLHSPVVKNVLLLIQDDVSAEFLLELFSSSTQNNNNSNSFASQKEKLIPINFSSVIKSSEKRMKDIPEKFKELDQPLYSDFFSVAEQYLHPTRDVAAICNSDIHFHTKQFIEGADVKKWFFSSSSEKRRETVMALTRYEEDVSSFNPEETGKNNHNIIRKKEDNNTNLSPRDVTVSPLIDDYRGSHDAFLFRPGVLDRDFILDVQHPQNAYQSENIVIDAFMKLNERRNGLMTAIDLRNPSKTGGFRIAHKHESEVRQWYPPLNDGRYGKVVPE